MDGHEGNKQKCFFKSGGRGGVLRRYRRCAEHSEVFGVKDKKKTPGWRCVHAPFVAKSGEITFD